MSLPDGNNFNVKCHFLMIGSLKLHDKSLQQKTVGFFPEGNFSSNSFTELAREISPPNFTAPLIQCVPTLVRVGVSFC